MMRKNLKQVQSFITFDLPVNTQHIGSLFTLTHYHHLTSIPNWSFSATRKKIIAKYWFEYVLIHFIVLVGAAAFLSLPLINIFDKYYLPILCMVSALSFVVMFTINYWPTYYKTLLPQLDSLVNEYEKRHAEVAQEKWLARLQSNLSQENEQLSVRLKRNFALERELLAVQLKKDFAHEHELLAAQHEELAQERQQLEAMQQEQIKCRKEQLSTFSLALIFYVFDKTSGMNSLQCNDQCASALAKVFGKDPTGLKKSLQLISAKKQNLPLRHRTEILKHFEAAYKFFEERGFNQGIQLLQSLESKFKEKH